MSSPSVFYRCLLWSLIMTGVSTTHAQPTLEWITRLGSDTATMTIEGIAAADSGNVYVVGWANANFGTPLVSHHGQGDMLLAKFDSTGALQWHTFFGSSGREVAYAIAVDESENVYLTGFGTADFGLPVNPHTEIDLSSDPNDILVAKFDSAGTPLWHTFHGTGGENIFGGEDDIGYGIEVDAAGNVFVTGSSEWSWDVGTPVSGYGASASRQIVVFKLNGSGALQWHTFHGGSVVSVGRDIGVDPLGYIYVTGVSAETWGSPVVPHGASTAAVLFRLNPDGTLLWNTFSNGRGEAFSLEVSPSPEGGAWIAGVAGTAWVGDAVNPYGDEPLGKTQMAVARYRSNGTLIWQTFHGGADQDAAASVTLRGQGELYVSGFSANTWGAPIDAKASPPGTYCATATILNASTGDLRHSTFQCGAAGISVAGVFDPWSYWGQTRETHGTVSAAGQPLLAGKSPESWGTPIADFTGTGGFLAQLQFPFFPNISVEGEGLLGIVNGDDMPRPEDGTDLGGTGEDVGTVVQGYIIRNGGLGALQLTGSPRVAVSGTHASDFTVTEQPATPVVPGGESRFEITFDPSALGVRTATVTIESNDEDDGVFTFAIEGTGLPPQGEIVVQGNGIEIADGSTATSMADGTDFGLVPTGITTERVFTIGNTGTGNLDLTDSPPVRLNPGGTDFSVGFPVATTPVPPGGETTFTIRIFPTELGQVTASVVIENTDLNEDIYTFAIEAEAVPGYSIGGTINNLQGTDLTLSDGAGATAFLPFPGLTEFTLSLGLLDGTPYNVTVDVQPTMPDQFCTVENGTGTIMGADVTDVVVNCGPIPDEFTIGGTVIGLGDSSLVLANNCEEFLDIEADGAFEFTQPVLNGNPYSVIVSTQPGPGLYCIVEAGQGTVSGADVTKIQVICDSEDLIFLDNFEPGVACP